MIVMPSWTNPMIRTVFWRDNPHTEVKQGRPPHIFTAFWLKYSGNVITWELLDKSAAFSACCWYQITSPPVTRPVSSLLTPQCYSLLTGELSSAFLSISSRPACTAPTRIGTSRTGCTVCTILYYIVLNTLRTGGFFLMKKRTYFLLFYYIHLAVKKTFSYKGNNNRP